GQLRFDFFIGRLCVDGLLQRLRLGAGFTAEGVAWWTWIVAAATRTTGAPGATTVIAAAASEGASEAAARTEVALGIHDFGDARFDDFPFVVALNVEGFAISFHHTLAHLFGIEIAAAALALSAGRGCPEHQSSSGPCHDEERVQFYHKRVMLMFDCC